MALTTSKIGPVTPHEPPPPSDALRAVTLSNASSDHFVSAAHAAPPLARTPESMALPTNGRPVRHGDELTLTARAGETWRQLLERAWGGQMSQRLFDYVVAADGLAEAPRGEVVVPTLRALFNEQSNAVAPSAALWRARFVVSTPRQRWLDLATPLLPKDATHTERAELAELIASFNGRSQLEPLPAVVAVPARRDLVCVAGGVTRRLRRRRKLALDPTLIRAMGGTLDNPAKLPVAGQAYAPCWNANLRSAVLLAYHDQLTKVPRDELGAEVERRMLALAAINGLTRTALGGYEAIWIPDDATLTRMIALVDAQQDDATQQQLEHSAIARMVRGAGKGAAEDLAAMSSMTVATFADGASHARDALWATAPQARGHGGTPTHDAINAAELDGSTEVRDDTTAESLVAAVLPQAQGSERKRALREAGLLIQGVKALRRAGHIDTSGRVTSPTRDGERGAHALARGLLTLPGASQSARGLLLEVLGANKSAEPTTVDDLLGLWLAYFDVPERADPRDPCCNLFRRAALAVARGDTTLEPTPADDAQPSADELVSLVLPGALRRLGLSEDGIEHMEEKRRVLTQRMEVLRATIRVSKDRREALEKIAADTLRRLIERSDLRRDVARLEVSDSPTKQA